MGAALATSREQVEDIRDNTMAGQVMLINAHLKEPAAAGMYNVQVQHACDKLHLV